MGPIPQKLCLPFLVLVAIAWSSAFALGGEATEGNKNDTSQKIEELIEKLASPNPKPTIIDSGDGIWKIKYPPGFSHDAQKKVLAARDQLAAKEAAAFPYLIERYDDRHYSMSICTSINEAWYNYSVGWVCSDIIRKHIEPLGPFTEGKEGNDDPDPRFRPPRPFYFDKFLQAKVAARAWWKTHSDKSLREMQIEAIEWTIAEEKKRNEPKDAADLEYLPKVLKKLKKSDKPLPPDQDYP